MHHPHGSKSFIDVSKNVVLVCSFNFLIPVVEPILNDTDIVHFERLTSEIN
jgi:hypothetical protein